MPNSNKASRNSINLSVNVKGTDMPYYISLCDNFIVGLYCMHSWTSMNRLPVKSNSPNLEQFLISLGFGVLYVQKMPR